MTMTKEWLEWTRLNLERGCSPAEIRDILEKNNFSSSEIDTAMQPPKTGFFRKLKTLLSGKPDNNTAHSSAAIQSRVPRQNLDYEKMSRPRITRNPSACKIDDTRIQLYTVDNFLNPSECQAVIDVINAHLRPSTITDEKKNLGFRTSSTCDLALTDHTVIRKIDAKISRLLGIRSEWSEPIQGQKYAVGQEFKAHTDFFEPNSKEYAEYASLGGQRTWTFMVYLNDTPAGGETYFTALDIAFKPKAGQAVIWNNLLPSGEPNDNTIHHGMPVKEGEKIIITKWFRDKGKGTPYLSNNQPA